MVAVAREWYVSERGCGTRGSRRREARALAFRKGAPDWSDRATALTLHRRRIMPRVPFETLPDDARVWVFGCESALAAPGSDRLLNAVDEFLDQWNAHGEPLRSARAWRDDRFLAIGVDQSTAGASGCSIDGLFRTLARLEPELGTRLLGGGRVYYRDADGRVHATTRAAFTTLAREGAVGPETPAFDTALTAAADWRQRFERPVRESWHGQLIDG